MENKKKQKDNIDNFLNAVSYDLAGDIGVINNEEMINNKNRFDNQNSYNKNKLNSHISKDNIGKK